MEMSDLSLVKEEEPSSTSFPSMIYPSIFEATMTPGPSTEDPPSSSSEEPSPPEPKRMRLGQIPELMMADEGIKADYLLSLDASDLFPAPVKPSLNNRQLAYLAMKNANFMPLQTPHICDFIEHVFPYYASGDDKWKIKWRNALSGGVRTAKCDDRLFVTNSMWGSGLRMFYKMNMERAEYFEQQIQKWRQSYDADTVHLSGLSSMEELELVASGQKGIAWVIPNPEEHMERYRKSTLPDVSTKGILHLKPEHCHPAAMALFSPNVDSPFQINGSVEKATSFVEEDEERQREKAELRRQRKNERVKCLVCSKMVCRKSLPRHLRGMHKFEDVDMMGYKLEELDRKMQTMHRLPSHEQLFEAEEDVKPSLLMLDPPIFPPVVAAPPPMAFGDAPFVYEPPVAVAEPKEEPHEEPQEEPHPQPEVEDEEVDVKPSIESLQAPAPLDLRSALAELSASTSTETPRNLSQTLAFLQNGAAFGLAPFEEAERVEITVGPQTPVSPEDTVEEEENGAMELDFSMLEKVQQQWMIKNRRVHCRLCNKRVSKKSLPRHLRTLHGLEEEQRQEYYRAAKIDPLENMEDISSPSDLPIDSAEEFTRLAESGEYDKETLKKMWRNRKVSCRLCCKLVNYKSRPRHLRTLHGFTPEQIHAYNKEEGGRDASMMMMMEDEEEGQTGTDCPKCQQSFPSVYFRQLHEVQCSQSSGGELFLEPAEDVKPEICIRLGANGPACSNGYQQAGSV